jgi:predicted Rossmann fold nucleotide-binding protein DprA/Smf involved in DNA uptake
MIRPHYMTPPAEESLPLFAAARRSDPATSHEAAKTAPVAEHQRLIMDALTQGPAGASGIAARCGLLGHQVNKRLGELARTGRIVETGRTVLSNSGRSEREWRCV